MTHNDIPVCTSTPKTLGFLLIDGFPLMAYASIIESYRAANALSGQALYEWKHISTDGLPCRASNGATIVPDLAVGMPHGCDTLFIFAGGDPTGYRDTRMFSWLRHVANSGTTMVGVSAGAYIMAQAGLLTGRRATIHWEYREAFIDAFPTTVCESSLFVFDGRYVTCAGGMAGMDLAIELIMREQGHSLAVAVSDWYIRSESRLADRPQRLSLRDRYDISSERVLRALARMKETIEEPSSRECLAQIAGVSVRQLERLFRTHIGESISKVYLGMRLDHAEQLLRSTLHNATEVAIASGFTNMSYFSRVYREKFGRPPSAERRRRRATRPSQHR